MATNHALLLGKLVGDLQSLEALLRLYLVKRGARKRGIVLPHPSHTTVSVGDYIPEDEFTNYDTLGELITKFNTDIGAHDPSLTVETSVVALRDLLAHGRISADVPDQTRLMILKFDRPTGGQVRVAAAALMDDEWFQTNIQLVLKQIVRVDAALNRHAA